MPPTFTDPKPATGKLVTGPAPVGTLPMVTTRLALTLANHIAPSGPAVIPVGWSIPAPVGRGILPAGVIRPTELKPLLVNHRLPSGPAAIPSAAIPGAM